jgi:hypothetical protein
MYVRESEPDPSPITWPKSQAGGVPRWRKMWRSRGRGLVLLLLVVMAAPALGKVFGVPREYRYLDYTDAAPSQEKVKYPSATGGDRRKGE